MQRIVSVGVIPYEVDCANRTVAHWNNLGAGDFFQGYGNSLNRRKPGHALSAPLARTALCRYGNVRTTYGATLLANNVDNPELARLSNRGNDDSAGFSSLLLSRGH